MVSGIGDAAAVLGFTLQCLLRHTLETWCTKWTMSSAPPWRTAVPSSRPPPWPETVVHMHVCPPSFDGGLLLSG